LLVSSIVLSSCRHVHHEGDDRQGLVDLLSGLDRKTFSRRRHGLPQLLGGLQQGSAAAQDFARSLVLSPDLQKQHRVTQQPLAHRLVALSVGLDQLLRLASDDPFACEGLGHPGAGAPVDPRQRGQWPRRHAWVELSPPDPFLDLERQQRYKPSPRRQPATAAAQALRNGLGAAPAAGHDGIHQPRFLQRAGPSLPAQHV
jgi:hypothetical protein